MSAAFHRTTCFVPCFTSPVSTQQLEDIEDENSASGFVETHGAWARGSHSLP
jgi:hypothetical protein